MYQGKCRECDRVWRITFKVEDVDAYDVNLEDYH